MCSHRVAPLQLKPLKRVSTSSLEKGIFSISSILAEGESTLSLSSCSPKLTRPASASSCSRSKKYQNESMELSLRRNETLPNLDSPIVEQVQEISIVRATDPTPSHVSTFLRNRLRPPQIKEEKIEEESGLFGQLFCAVSDIVVEDRCDTNDV